MKHPWRTILAGGLLLATVDVAMAAEVSTLTALYAALEAATPDPEIIVAPGTYRLTKTLTVPAGVTLRSSAGRDQTVFKMSENLASIDCAANLLGAGSVLSGFTFTAITNSEATANCLVKIVSGTGGMMTNCCARQCHFYYGAVLVNGLATVADSVFDNNESVSSTAGLIVNFNAGSGKSVAKQVLFNRVQITRNRACTNAAGKYQNTYGACMLSNSGTCTYLFRNCTIADNWAKIESSPAIYSQYRNVTLTNCIVVVSSALPNILLKGVHVNPSSTGVRNLTARRCFVNGIEQSSTAYSDILTGADVGFVNPANGDYHLKADSPCVGAAADGGDLGCYAYDGDYVDPTPVLKVGATRQYATIQEAYNAAAPGSRIEIDPGHYVIANESLQVLKDVHIVGVNGRDNTFVTAGDTGYKTGFRPLYLNSELATVEGLTFHDAASWSTYEGTHGGAGVCIGNWGGGLINCRITHCTDGSNAHAGNGLTMLSGYADRCEIDSCYGKGPAVALYCTKRDAGFVDVRGIMLNSFVHANTNSTVGGPTVLLQVKSSGAKGGLDEQPILANSTVVGNQADVAVQRVCGFVENCILRDSSNDETLCWVDGGVSGNDSKTVYSPTLATTGTTSTVWLNVCTPVAVGTNCVAAAPLLKSSRNCKLKAESPCIAKAKVLDAYGFKKDYFGNSRLRKDGTQDIGCCQFMPSGLIMLVR